MNKLYIMCGIPFAGKTTLANEIVKLKNFTKVDLDEVKISLFGSGIEDQQLQKTDWDNIYQQMYHHIQIFLAQEKTVLHDTGNFTRHERGNVRNIAAMMGIEAITIFVDTPVEEARKRLDVNRLTNERFDISDQAFLAAVTEMEIPDISEKSLIYNGVIPMEEWIRRNID